MRRAKWTQGGPGSGLVAGSSGRVRSGPARSGAVYGREVWARSAWYVAVQGVRGPLGGASRIYPRPRGLVGQVGVECAPIEVLLQGPSTNTSSDLFDHDLGHARKGPFPRQEPRVGCSRRRVADSGAGPGGPDGRAGIVEASVDVVSQVPWASWLQVSAEEEDDAADVLRRRVVVAGGPGELPHHHEDERRAVAIRDLRRRRLAWSGRLVHDPVEVPAVRDSL